MRRQNTEAIGEVIKQFLRETGLEKPFLEQKIPEVWKQVLGDSICRYTGEMEVKNGVLFVHISSAALRQELFIGRNQLVEKLNEAVGAKVIDDIRLLA